MSGALWLDALVLVVYFALVFGIGLSQRKKSGSLEGFALAGREISWWAVLASILAAEISAGTFFGTPGEGYQLRNYTYVQLIVGYLLARVIVSAFFIPAFYRHNVVSIYEFLETRFGPRTRRMASAVFLVTRTLASGSRLWVPTILFVLIWQLAQPAGSSNAQHELWLTAAALIIITIATTIYTAVGGIRAVIWTDVLQMLVLFSALGFSLFHLLGHIPGGWTGAKEHLTGPNDLRVIDWGIKAGAGFWENVKGVLEQEYTVWAALLGSTFVTLATHGTDQDMVQRMLTAKNQRQSAAATILSGLADIPIVMCVLTIGILLSVYYQLSPDLRLPSGANKAFPFFVLTQMPPGLRGLVIAGVLATTMGSLSTALNSLATSYVRDFHFRWFGEPAGDAGKVRALRLGTVLFAALLVGVALATAWVVATHPQLRILPIILGIFGYTYGSLLGVFLVGLFTSRGSCAGNALAMVAGFIVVSVLSGLHSDVFALITGARLPQPAWLPVIEFPWRILFGTAVTFLIAVCFRTPPAQLEKMRLAIATHT
ncbi:MAG TPA: sodium:solute symporter [Chthoniobacteraceae bacterium]|jgi:SSS family transporter|nr:sodium:solute symporter [Chthoniobacteraceae bacterium]